MYKKASVELVRGLDGPDISFNGRLLLSTKNEFKRRFKQIPLQSQTLYVVCSPLLCCGLEELEAAIPENSFLLLVEQDKKLFELGLNYYNDLGLKRSFFVFAEKINLNDLIIKYTNLKIRQYRASKA